MHIVAGIATTRVGAPPAYKDKPTSPSLELNQDDSPVVLEEETHVA